MIHRFRRFGAIISVIAVIALSGCEAPSAGDSSAETAAESLYASSDHKSSENLSSGVSTSSDASAPVSSSCFSSSRNLVSSRPPENKTVSTERKPPVPSGFSTSYDDTGKKITPDTLIGVWFAYYELTFQKRTEQEFESGINAMFAKAASLGCNAVFCHVRPFADSYYPSKIFPWSSAGSNSSVPQGTDPGYDPLAVMIKCARAHKLQFHAWINPYRVAAGIALSADPWSVLSENHPVRLWLTDGDAYNDEWAPVTRNIASGDAAASNKSIALNPAVPEVQKLIIDGIREILENYDVDGIHFDDYFYPTTSPDFDKKTYAAYCAEAGENALELGDWRRANVSALVGSVCSLTRSYGRTFGISPAASISVDHMDMNYRDLYADVTRWMAGNGYVDYIMPQLYFGFDYPDEYYRYEYLLGLWSAMPRHSSVKLYIGLSPYRIGSGDKIYDEWQVKDDIIARQARLAVQRGDGFVLFSYSSLSGTALRDTQTSKLKQFISENKAK